MVCKADPLERVLVTRLQDSATAVLAQPVTANRLRISKVLKSEDGGLQPGGEVEATLPLFSTDAGKVGQGSVLLTRRDEKADWIIRAPANLLHQIAFYQKVVAMPSDLAETRRAAFFLRYLHHADPLLDRAAAAEIANAPYVALKTLKEDLKAEKIRAKLADPETAEGRALYYTLLGVCGDETDRDRINARLARLWESNGSRNLPAMLTAKLELEGEPAVDEIEARYFRDRKRTLPEIEAAVLALRVHGDADLAVSRQRVIESYQSFFDDREPLIFYIAEDLARWEDWDSKDRLVAIAAERGDDLPAIRRAVEAYLESHPKHVTGLKP